MVSAPPMPGLLHVDRETFLRDHFWYQEGETLSVIARSGWGKTTFLNQIMVHIATPESPVVVLSTKPRDKTVSALARDNQWPIIREWPPPPWVTLFRAKPSGYVLWPKHTMDPDKDEPNHYLAFRLAMLRMYKKGKIKINADEVFTLQQLGLTRVINTIYKNGRAMNTPILGGTQEPANVTTSMYRQVPHLLLGGINDKRSRQRFAEIGGAADPKLIDPIVTRLRKYQFLYVRTEDGAMCTIDAT